MSAEPTLNLDELRWDFDQAFTLPPPNVDRERESVIVLDLGASIVALRLSELKGLHPLPPLMPLPEPSPGLLGLAGSRGQIVPAYDLAALLGLGACERPKWMVLCGEEPVGLVFSELRHHVHVTASEILEAESQAPPWIAGMLTDGGQRCHLLHLPPLIAVSRHGREAIRKDG